MIAGAALPRRQARASERILVSPWTTAITDTARSPKGFGAARLRCRCMAALLCAAPGLLMTASRPLIKLDVWSDFA